MKTIFSIFLQGDRRRSFLVVVSLLIAALVEALSIGALLPAAASQFGQGGDGSKGGQIAKFILDWTGLTPTFGSLLLLFATAAVLKVAISFTAMSYAAVTAAEIGISFRERLINAVFGASWRFYADQHAGTFATALANDAYRASQAYMLSAQVIAAGLQAVLLAAVAVAYNWQLALASLAVGLAIGVAMNGLIKMSRRAGRKEADATGDLTVKVVDLLSNMKPLKAMHRFEPLLLPLQRILRKMKRALVAGDVSRLAYNAGNELIVTLLIAAMAYVAYTYWKVTIPELVVIGVIFFKMNEIIAKIQKAIQQSVKFERSYQRITDLTKLAESYREKNPGAAEVRLVSGCRFEGVSFSHAEAEVIRDVDLEIPAGKITVLKGPSGAGKTTLIDLLIGLYRPDRGRISIDGVALDDIDLFGWRRRIGYVPQELSLLHANIRDNITFGDPAISDEAVWSALRQATADGFVSSLPHGLDSTVGEMGGKISGGQRQRISLSRALVTAPELLILDEVTSALDPATEQEIVANIASLRGRYTIVAITHRPAWTAIADRLYEVSGGQAWVVNESQAGQTAAE